MKRHGPCTYAVEVSPDEIDAGAELTITVRASCPHGCGLAGQRVSIRNEDGAALARIELGAVKGEAWAAATCALQAPADAREHSWHATLAAYEQNGAQHDETSTGFSFTTRAHIASVNVWALPSAIVAGERFRFNVGIKCSAGCNLTGRQLTIFDHDGEQAGTGRLREEVWPGTSALYFADMEARAPLAPGDYAWRLESPGAGDGLPHAAGACAFAVKVVSAPDHEVTVEAIDGEKQVPIGGAHVLLHPYRAYTDERGMAKVKVAKGRYKLFVSGFNYIAYEGVLDVAGDVAMRAELTVEPEGQEDYR
jgi:hypothetical protein